MNRYWKLVETFKFLGLGYFSSKPSNYQFRDFNRAKFHEHLEAIEGLDVQSKQWLYHLKNINYYCDEQQVILMDGEKEELEKLYNMHTNTTSRKVAEKEDEVFAYTARNFFEDGTLNHDVRAYRPDPDLLPDGAIRFKAKDA